MRLLVYQTLDLVDDYARVKTKKQQMSVAKLYNENTYLGLLFEGLIGEYEFDIYGYISNTKYKYLLVKNDTH